MAEEVPEGSESTNGHLEKAQGLLEAYEIRLGQLEALKEELKREEEEKLAKAKDEKVNDAKNILENVQVKIDKVEEEKKVWSICLLLCLLSLRSVSAGQSPDGAHGYAQCSTLCRATAAIIPSYLNILPIAVPKLPNIAFPGTTVSRRKWYSKFIQTQYCNIMLSLE